MKELFFPALLFYSVTRLHIRNKSSPSPAPSPTLSFSQHWNWWKVRGLGGTQTGPPLDALRYGHTRRGSCRGYSPLSPGPPGTRARPNPEPAAPAAPLFSPKRRAAPYLHTVIDLWPVPGRGHFGSLSKHYTNVKVILMSTHICGYGG